MAGYRCGMQRLRLAALLRAVDGDTLGGRSRRDLDASFEALVTHWALGHIDWSLAFAFTVGLVPASLAGAKLSSRLTGGMQRRAFGWFLIGFGTLFTIYRLALG